MAAQKRKHQRSQSANRKKPKVSNKPELKKRPRFTSPSPRIVELGSDEEGFTEPPKSQSANLKKPKVSGKQEAEKRKKFSASIPQLDSDDDDSEGGAFVEFLAPKKKRKRPTGPHPRIVELDSGDDDGSEGEGEGEEVSFTESPRLRPINSKKPKGLTGAGKSKRVAELDDEVEVGEVEDEVEVEEEEEEDEEEEQEEEGEEEEQEEEGEDEEGEEEEEEASAGALEDSEEDNMDIDTTSKTPTKPSSACKSPLSPPPPPLLFQELTLPSLKVQRITRRAKTPRHKAQAIKAQRRGHLARKAHLGATPADEASCQRAQEVGGRIWNAGQGPRERPRLQARRFADRAVGVEVWG